MISIVGVVLPLSLSLLSSLFIVCGCCIVGETVDDDGDVTSDGMVEGEGAIGDVVMVIIGEIVYVVVIINIDIGDIKGMYCMDGAFDIDCYHYQCLCCNLN